jgi:hypothetical protein
MSEEPSDLKVIEDRIRTVEILLAGLLLKERPSPRIEKLEALIGIRKGTLSELFPKLKLENRKLRPSAKVRDK